MNRLVVKVGTSVLTGGKGFLDEQYLAGLVEMLCSVHSRGTGVALVTSGAIAVGVRLLKLDDRPSDVVLSQVAAAVGQGHLIHGYTRCFERHGVTAAQVLLTQDVMEQRERYLNTRNALNRMLELGVVPVINENDTVAVEEICFGDNDRLSAVTACVVEADLLIILSDIPGICTGDPNKDSGAEVIAEVECNDQRLEFADGSGKWGSGGIRSKIQAAGLAAAAGIPTVVADGRLPEVVQRILAGEKIGTRFRPADADLNARKRWILTRPTTGELIINHGAAEALTRRGGSLLPAGILEVKGYFQRGEAVAVMDERGKRLAVGITEFDARDIRASKGLKSSEIMSLMGRKCPSEAVHRDNMVLVVHQD